jgi:hypothetical protein
MRLPCIDLRTLPEILTAKDLEAFLRIDVKTIYSYVQRAAPSASKDRS